MPTTLFDRDSMAQWYAHEHLKTDPGIRTIHYLPTDAGEREIRFIEINTLLADRTDDALEPIDFGVDMGSDNAHSLYVLDVTENQWTRLESGKLALPKGWSLADKATYSK
ncbi:MAG: hypothetical protein ACKPEY_05330 [Planctomycetota bacterium]